MARSVTKIVLAGAAGLVVLFASDNVSLTNSSSLVTQAEARVGRPLSPVSVAGVARRNTRRAVGVGVVGAAAVGAAAVGRRCYMTQNGQVCE
jgi:multisubunit Na+/H+ antiporter MnhB subunit